MGSFAFDLVAAIFGGQTAGLSRLIYTLVGISGIVYLFSLFADDTETAADREVIEADDRNITPSYGTEFAEEPDLDQLYNPSREEYEKENEK